MVAIHSLEAIAESGLNGIAIKAAQTLLSVDLDILNGDVGLDCAVDEDGNAEVNVVGSHGDEEGEYICDDCLAGFLESVFGSSPPAPPAGQQPDPTFPPIHFFNQFALKEN